MASLGLGLRVKFRPQSENNFSSNVPVVLTRSTEAWSQDPFGKLYRFAPDVPRQTDRGRQISGAARREHGEAPTNGINTAGTTSSTLAAEGLFNPVRVTSGGHTWHRRLTDNLNASNGTRVYCRVRARAGTSGRIAILCSNFTAGVSTEIRGTLASPSVTSSNAGTITDFINRELPNGDREYTFTWTLNANGISIFLGIGPDSAVTGEYIDVIGTQAASAYTDWIMGGDTTKAIAADIMSLDLTGLDMTAGFMLKMVGIVDATPGIGFLRLYQAGDSNNRNLINTNETTAAWHVGQFAASVNQGTVEILSTVTPPAAFSIVGAHGIDYIGGAYDGDVRTPDTSASYVTPTTLFIGSVDGEAALPITISRIELVPGAPTTALVTELAA